MYGGHHDMGGALIVELLDSLAKIGLIDLDAVFFKIGAHVTFIHEH